MPCGLVKDGLIRSGRFVMNDDVCQAWQRMEQRVLHPFGNLVPLFNRRLAVNFKVEFGVEPVSGPPAAPKLWMVSASRATLPLKKTMITAPLDRLWPV